MPDTMRPTHIRPACAWREHGTQVPQGRPDLRGFPARTSRRLFVVVRFENSREATFKQLIMEDGRQCLKDLNPDWPRRTIRLNSKATICGVVVFKGQRVLISSCRKSRHAANGHPGPELTVARFSTSQWGTVTRAPDTSASIQPDSTRSGSWPRCLRARETLAVTRPAVALQQTFNPSLTGVADRSGPARRRRLRGYSRHE